MPAGQRFVKTFGNHRRFINLQSHPVPEKIRPPVAKAHEILQKFRVETSHGIGINRRRYRSGFQQRCQPAFKFHATPVARNHLIRQRPAKHIDHCFVGVIAVHGTADVHEHKVAFRSLRSRLPSTGAAGFGGRLHVGADAAVPEQVDRRRQNRVDQLAGVILVPDGDARGALATCGVIGTDLRSGRRRRRPARSASGRSRPTTSGQARTARLRSAKLAAGRARVEETCRWSKAATSLMCCESSIPLPNTSPDMSPMPTTVKSCGGCRCPASAEVAADRLPRAARGDAHRLVVVALGAAGREGVAEPEPVARSRSRWRCRRTSRCPCPPRRRGTGRRRRSGALGAGRRSTHRRAGQ